mmetsp:Transcript_14028/g.36905  ORF Transcript_14028/g.36905 Transcript_14028/m.36905 type:complete len:289 (-) Transcript_14028:69-935(-)
MQRLALLALALRRRLRRLELLLRRLQLALQLPHLGRVARGRLGQLLSLRQLLPQRRRRRLRLDPLSFLGARRALERGDLLLHLRPLLRQRLRRARLRRAQLLLSARRRLLRLCCGGLVCLAYLLLERSLQPRLLLRMLRHQPPHRLAHRVLALRLQLPERRAVVRLPLRSFPPEGGPRLLQHPPRLLRRRTLPANRMPKRLHLRTARRLRRRQPRLEIATPRRRRRLLGVLRLLQAFRLFLPLSPHGRLRLQQVLLLLAVRLRAPLGLLQLQLQLIDPLAQRRLQPLR